MVYRTYFFLLFFWLSNNTFAGSLCILKDATLEILNNPNLKTLHITNKNIDTDNNGQSNYFEMIDHYHKKNLSSPVSNIFFTQYMLSTPKPNILAINNIEFSKINDYNYKSEHSNLKLIEKKKDSMKIKINSQTSTYSAEVYLECTPYSFNAYREELLSKTTPMFTKILNSSILK